MARPRLGNSESKRLQMVITEDELKAVEDWQFANRSPSKSEAMRRLVQIGIVSHSALPEMMAGALALSDMLVSVGEACGELLPDQEDQTDWRSVALFALEAVGDLALQSADLSALVASVAKQHAELASSSDLAQALKRVEELRERAERARTAIKREDIEALAKTERRDRP